eukprot:gnl/TRDRNA2_/TRDRNA2_33906_c0_seq2.p1 gnl/TRDRNA2_/TRDRNA2_33906_c0~~gnl/TRDRNA2_/TRDRNA2_33906_c0_seq2.p1  ORF type:complete len:314 (+),score=36.12 gnl/TRDRNA2_/TRDRNA2_33906_c0_seq2:126-1067(+)
MASQQMSVRARALFCGGFGFVTGFTNVICLRRYKAFGTMMTGNLLMMGLSAVESGLSEGGGMLPAPVFFALVIVARSLGLLLHLVLSMTPVKRVGVSLILAPAMVMVVFAAGCLRFQSAVPWIPERWDVFWVAILFGVQSAVTHPTLSTPTMVLTGHMTNMLYTTVQASLGASDVKMSSLVVPSSIVAAAFVGAVFGAAADVFTEGSKMASFVLTPICFFQGILLVWLEQINNKDDSKIVQTGAMLQVPYTPDATDMRPTGMFALANKSRDSVVVRANEDDLQDEEDPNEPEERRPLTPRDAGDRSYHPLRPP